MPLRRTGSFILSVTIPFGDCLQYRLFVVDLDLLSHDTHILLLPAAYPLICGDPRKHSDGPHHLCPPYVCQYDGLHQAPSLCE